MLNQGSSNLDWIDLRDRGDFAGLFSEIWRVGYKTGFSILKSCDKAHDVAQETCLKTLPKVYDFQEELHFRLYVHRVAYNCAIDILRGGAHDRLQLPAHGNDNSSGPDVASPDPNPEQALQKAEKNELLARCLGQLSERERMIVELRLAGYDNPEIALLLGLTYSQVATHLNRAKTKLRECCKKGA